MSEAILQRNEDPSGVSGTGPVAEIFEATDGAVAIRWRGDRPSWGLWSDIRDLEAIHGHGGKSVVTYLEPHRLLASYQHVMPFLLREQMRPITCGPHPDHPDRLRLTFQNEQHWSFYIALLDGSTHAATHVEEAGEIRHRWITPDGDLFLEWWERPESTSSPSWGYGQIAPDWEEQMAGERYDEDPLETFDREDR